MGRSVDYLSNAVKVVYFDVSDLDSMLQRTKMETKKRVLSMSFNVRWIGMISAVISFLL